MMDKSDSAESGLVTRSSPNPIFWVGIGASAGGLEALRGLVRNLPADLPAAFVVVQHMSPHHRSLLAEIIGRETDMPVLDVVDDLEPAAHSLYVTPPNCNLVVDNGRLRLVEPSTLPASPKPSVDVFFESLAHAKRESAVGIILSGSGSDGSRGIRAIKDHGGIAIAQDEMTAKYGSMPAAAAATGCVDLIMSPEEIGTQFEKIIQVPRNLGPMQASKLDLDGTAELVQLLLDQTRVNFRHYKTATMQRRIERRMAAVNIEALDDYVQRAKESPEEVEALFRDLLISVTSFFRDPEEFEALRSHIRTIIEQKRGAPIRVWVPGTATGEEAYTLAILFAEELGGAREFARSSIQIFATDIDSKAIDTARRATYPTTALDGVPVEYRELYFDRATTGFTVKKAVRDKIVFSEHNVAQDPPYLNIDLVSCRNLLIYFQTELQERVFSRFHYALVPRGVLFLGKAEAVAASGALFRQARSDRHIFYQRPSTERRLLREYDPVQPRRRRKSASDSAEADANAEDLETMRSQFDSLVAAVGPQAILVNEQLLVVRAYGELERYIGLSPGTVDNTMMSLLREPYLREVRAVVPSAMRRLETVRGVVRADPEQPDRREQINVYPIVGGPNDETFAVVAFNEWFVDLPTSGDRAKADESEEVERLRQELAIAHDRLRQLTEDAGLTSESMQTLNEELQATNEELQSTNEEMETSNEELQSTNEELSTVNDELQVNASQLNAVNQSLRSVLDNVAIPMLVVDEALYITHASRAWQELFDLDPALDLPHISRCRVPKDFPNLVELLEEAMTTEVRVDRTIHDNLRSTTLTVVPHFSTYDDVVGGMVFISDHSEELRRTRNELQLVMDSLPASIIVRNSEGLVLKANKVASELLAKPINKIEGRTLDELWGDEALAQILQYDAEAIESGKPLLTGDVSYTAPNGSTKILSTSRVPVSDGRSSDQLIYWMAIDVTEQRQAAEALAESEQRLERVFQAAGLAPWEVDLVSGSVFLSDRFEEILEVAVDEYNHDLDVIASRLHPEDLALIRELHQKWSPSAATTEIDVRFLHADGTYRWLSLVAEVIVDVDSKPTRIVGTARDVTARKNDDLALVELNDQLQLASKLSGVGFWKVDTDDDSIFWSEEVFRVHGVDKSEGPPDIETALNFYHPEDRASVQAGLSQAIDDGLPFEFETRLVRTDGEIRLVRSKASVAKDPNGRVSSVFGVFIDVTDDRERERELEHLLAELSKSNEELNRFSYVCSHDMKEPVRMIESMVALLLEPDIDLDQERRNELLTRIGRNMVRLRATIDGLLAYSRVEATVAVSAVALDEVVSELIEMHHQDEADGEVELVVGDLPTVQGARVHFSQLFQNLIGNAFKYANRKRSVVHISSEDVEGFHVIRVDDNGPGIPTESRETIFELFGRLNPSEEIEGTGIGLAICRRIVTQYGGTIHCETSEAGGASFVIRLPKESSAHGA